MVIFHGTEWDTDGETHPNNPIPLIFKHRVLNMNEGRDSYQTIEVSEGFKPPKAQFFALLLTEGKAGKGPG